VRLSRKLNRAGAIVAYLGIVQATFHVLGKAWEHYFILMMAPVCRELGMICGATHRSTFKAG